MKKGAFDYLQKPFDNDELLAIRLGLIGKNFKKTEKKQNRNKTVTFGR